jgi:hypothetical protein
VSTEVSYSRTTWTCHQGFVTDRVIGRLDYAFSPKMTLSSLIQFTRPE